MDDTYELNLKNLAGWIASCALVFGAVVPYVPQYKEIKRKEDAEGFSLYVCLTLLIANTLRILFWFGKHYELPLLLQSILMILAMFVMIKLCINVQNRTQIIKAKDRVLTGGAFLYFADLDARFFWKWTDFKSYLGFMVLFAGIGGVITYLFLDIPIFIEIIGFLAVLIEAMLGVPQFLRNSSNKSTVGMSIAMVAMWTIGDIFKTCYFILRDTPVQFQVCGAVQVTIDVAILAQVYLYKTNNNVHTRAPTRSD
ncbi:PQ-loop repeat-containing protein 1 isoform X1 [Mycetomoellerius zeteki]|uniref:PQ-loop repeat-containing protein 1 isoform X1 n=1 Tax=Mycetomoellerius zeteki TaxID=64791 RepID=UPI00084ECD00|nr:PREDICTED: PQ-loop repeat-containing protein 1 isoform X1 [Trachymyrmex zeteki]XP_018310846.1 PREDICTED: PQ-loop repeat-containing protein 1 isoform X1 [Trachymyrmex zeteki]